MMNKVSNQEEAITATSKTDTKRGYKKVNSIAVKNGKADRHINGDECISRHCGSDTGGNSGVTVHSFSSSHNKASSMKHRWWNIWVITALILLLGGATTAAFVGLGISSSKQELKHQFEHAASDIIKKIEAAWEDYLTASSTIHVRCRSRNFTRTDFRDLYEYLIRGEVDFQALQFVPYISQQERSAAEAEARSYYTQYYPNMVTYHGFVGFESDNATQLTNRPQQDFYYPVHYMEPVVGNERAIDLDYYASGSLKATVEASIKKRKPSLTDRLHLVTEDDNQVAYGVVLMHPGINLTSHPTDVWPRDVASIVIRIPDLLKSSLANQEEESYVYIYDDISDPIGNGPAFLGAVAIHTNKDGTMANITDLPEIQFSQLGFSDLQFFQQINAADKVWTVVVISEKGTFRTDDQVFVIVGGIVIFVASLCLAIWVPTNALRTARFNHLKAEADAEKASLILDNVRQAAKAEHELNDFMAHEVRNPVAAALSACSFVKRAIQKEPPLEDKESKETTREDVQTIENSLRFINDLLRNMLDMHRATSRQLKVNLTPTDILHDVLEPVQSMLIQRDRNVEVTIECPNSLWVLSDRLRLNQVMMNLGRNSSKFIDTGFIRLRARIVLDDNTNQREPTKTVEVSVEDSGTGIPAEKRSLLFNKYQESLDLLSQGTGIGLFLCKNLVELMDGEISLDESFISGIPGCPGTRFVINLRHPPLDVDSDNDFSSPFDGIGGALEESEAAWGSRKNGALARQYQNGDDDAEMGPQGSAFPQLPEALSVLFVDDDNILRKLFSRMVKVVAPTWTIREASNGETAILLSETVQFDLIFMDMYMASVEKQLLGTEAVQVLRNKGITCKICGLSANDMESKFLAAGADAFAFKPFPCEQRALTTELSRILACENKAYAK